jgi:hypothetical protein
MNANPTLLHRTVSRDFQPHPAPDYEDKAVSHLASYSPRCSINNEFHGVNDTAEIVSKSSFPVPVSC